MRKVENECVSCVDIGLHCLGMSCPNRYSVRFYCDRCGREEKLRRYEDEELCQDCLLEKFEIVEGSDNW